MLNCSGRKVGRLVDLVLQQQQRRQADSQANIQLTLCQGAFQSGTRKLLQSNIDWLIIFLYYNIEHDFDFKPQSS